MFPLLGQPGQIVRTVMLQPAANKDECVMVFFIVHFVEQQVRHRNVMQRTQNILQF